MSTRRALTVVMVIVSAGVSGCYPDRTNSTWRCYASSDCNQGYSCVEDQREGPGRWCISNVYLTNLDISNQDATEDDTHNVSDTTTLPAPSPGTRRSFGGSAYRYIPAGTFTMGSPSVEIGRDEREIQHSVTITQGFWMKETEVTQSEWQAVIINNPSVFNACGGNCPVENINWWDAVQYANMLSTQQGLSQCYTLSGCISPPLSSCDSVIENLNCTGYRLPTEAEWEYAYRAGTTTAFYSGGITQSAQCNLDANLNDIGWYCGNEDNMTRPASEKRANAWGLYDMAGNVFEWVWDWHGAYTSAPQSDPRGPQSGTLRILRGGSWYSSPEACRAAARYLGAPDDTTHVGLGVLGFRLIRSE